MISSSYGDYFDRPYMNDLFMVTFYSSILGIFGLPIQVFCAYLLDLYIKYQSLVVLIFVPKSSGMTDYFTDVVFKWNILINTMMII